jgi:hypothetical protein
MNDEADSTGGSTGDETEDGAGSSTGAADLIRAALPTRPYSVVWSRGHAYVLEDIFGRARWIGCDDRGRPLALTNADLERRGWSRTRAS